VENAVEDLALGAERNPDKIEISRSGGARCLRGG
jgi:hypothetical protein